MIGSEHKVAVITGASSGIGMATALKFAAEGYDVALAARRLSELQKVAKECEALGVSALPIVTDTTDASAIQALLQRSVAAFGHIDVWVNDAAVYLAGKFEDTPLKDMHRLIETNFFGYIHSSQSALSQFRIQGYGSLINVSSVNAVAPQPYVSIYSASKAAIRAFSESLRMELKIDGMGEKIHVCTVMPASIDTNIFQNGANYTGKKLQAVEPVYASEYVAAHIVSLATRPRREVIVGPAGKMMALQNALTPGMYERHIGAFTKADLLGKESAAETSGNLYEPLTEHVGAHGGWQQSRVSAKQFNVSVGITAAVAAVGLAGIGYALSRYLRRT